MVKLVADSSIPAARSHESAILLSAHLTVGSSKNLCPRLVISATEICNFTYLLTAL